MCAWILNLISINVVIRKLGSYNSWRLAYKVISAIFYDKRKIFLRKVFNRKSE
jgi:hypothetical protein